MSFILQRVPHMRPQVTITRLEPKDPRMLAWVTDMPCIGGGGPKFSYGSGFFRWLRNQLLMVEDYAYDGAEFRDDPELVLHEGEVWDDRGKKIHYPLVFLNFVFYFIFYFCSTEIKMFSCRHWICLSNRDVAYC